MGDLDQFDSRPFRSIDLVAGAVPCPLFSESGKHLGADVERGSILRGNCVLNKIRLSRIPTQNGGGVLGAVFANELGAAAEYA